MVVGLHSVQRCPRNSLKEKASMQILRILALAGIALGAYPQTVSRPEVVAVRAVVDGNTIDVAGYGRVKLAGIRATKDARDRLEGLVTHRYVRLEFPLASSRSAAYVLLETGTFVNAVLAREGLARVTGQAGPRADELRRAEAEAKAARRGVWARGNSATPNSQLPTPNSQDLQYGNWELGIGNWELRRDSPYSALRAMSGSTRVARRAGKMQAQSATIVRMIVIDANVSGSRAGT
jgi:endonuclease YncB( thermonuclease family)